MMSGFWTHKDEKFFSLDESKGKKSGDGIFFPLSSAQSNNYYR
jgi:hypothetical protein